MLVVACKRAPVEVPVATPELSAPEPSTKLVVTPLDTAATGYTNEMQAQAFTKETGELGIQQISKHMEEGESAPARESTQPLTEEGKKERMQQLKEMRQEFTRMRRGIDDARDKSVSLKGNTAAIIKGRESGGMLGASELAPGIWGGAYGGAVETGERVAVDKKGWAELWGLVSRETPPELDFKAVRVAAQFVGPRPTSGYAAKLLGIEAEATRYTIHWYEEGPAEGEAVAEGATAPFLLVAVPADDKAIRWDKKRRSEGPKRK